MPEVVNVDDFEVFRQFRAALVKFARAADQVLSGAESEISRTHGWLEGEQMSYWVGQRKKRVEAVAKAKDAVRQKKLYKDATGRTPGAVEEEKILAKCVAAVEEAERKVEVIRKWLPKFEKAADGYRGGVARLHASIFADIPKGIALLDKLAGSLEAYAQIEVPSSRAPTMAAGAGESFSRPPEEAVRVSPPAADSPAVVEEASEAPRAPDEEVRNVAG